MLEPSLGTVEVILYSTLDTQSFSLHQLDVCETDHTFVVLIFSLPLLTQLDASFLYFLNEQVSLLYRVVVVFVEGVVQDNVEQVIDVLAGNAKFF